MKQLSIILFMAVLLGGGRCIAQRQWTINFKPAISFPVAKNNGYHVKTGYGFDVSVGYVVQPTLSFQAGWGQNTFPAEKNINHLTHGYEESRFVAGVQFLKSLRKPRLNWMAGGDIIFVHLTSNNPDNDKENSGNGGGWRLNTGVAYNVGDRIKIIPQVSFTYLSAKLNNGGGTTTLKYASPAFQVSYTL